MYKYPWSKISLTNAHEKSAKKGMEKKFLVLENTMNKKRKVCKQFP